MLIGTSFLHQINLGHCWHSLPLDKKVKSVTFYSVLDRATYRRNYREKNRDKIRAYKRDWDSKNKDHVRKYNEKNYDPHHYLKWKKNNPEKAWQAQRTSHIKKKYNLSWEEYQQMLALQENSCALCHLQFKADDVPNVDHDHATGRIRGLLHGPCNRILANAKDNPTKLLQAIEYLDKHHRSFEKKNTKSAS